MSQCPEAKLLIVLEKCMALFSSTLSGQSFHMFTVLLKKVLFKVKMYTHGFVVSITTSEVRKIKLNLRNLLNQDYQSL